VHEVALDAQHLWPVLHHAVLGRVSHMRHITRPRQRQPLEIYYVPVGSLLQTRPSPTCSSLFSYYKGSAPLARPPAVRRRLAGRRCNPYQRPAWPRPSEWRTMIDYAAAMPSAESEWHSPGQTAHVKPVLPLTACPLGCGARQQLQTIWQHVNAGKGYAQVITDIGG
jgi:hypothetical protein